MNLYSRQLLSEALELPTTERGRLAAQLIESLETEVDHDAAASWSEEIQTRLDDIDAGRVEMIPWAEVRRRLRGQDDAAG